MASFPAPVPKYTSYGVPTPPPPRAAFVGASNLGMALGPLLSLPLAFLPEAQLAGIPVNPITAVGLVMALLWLAFLAAAAIWFKDPPAM